VHYYATVHGAIISLTNLEHCMSDSQHVEMGKPRWVRDNRDLSKPVDWFRANSSFSRSDSCLHSLSTELLALDYDHIICETAEAGGAKIQLKLDKPTFNTVVTKKVDRAITLNSLNGNWYLICAWLQQVACARYRLFWLSSGHCTMWTEHFQLVSKWAHCCTDSLIQRWFPLENTDTSLLVKLITAKVLSCETLPGTAIVVDGDWLLHKVEFQPGVSYIEIAHQYISFVVKYFGSAVIVVFDGYEMGPSIKDPEHSKRAAKSFQPQWSWVCCLSHLVVLQQQYTVHQAKDDADTLIVHGNAVCKNWGCCSCSKWYRHSSAACISFWVVNEQWSC